MPLRRILAVTDGRAANRTQALGLAEALARATGAEVVETTVALPRWADPLPQRLLAAIGPHIRASGIPGPLPAADLVIGAGRRGNLAASLAPAARRIAVLDPGLPFTRFDAVILPGHDARPGARVIETLGAMNRLTRPMPAWDPPLPAPRLALLLGGPSRSARFDRASLARLLDDLGRFAGWSVLVTASRRTPAWVVEALRDARPGAWVWGGAGPNPYPGLLGVAEAVMVTEDSVNMASEAAATGLPLFISGTGRVAPKLARFHAALRARGIARDARTGPAAWTYPPLLEAARVAALLLARFP